MTNTVGYYHSKETFGTVDGPGIRYVLFLTKCNLCCIFCHNPDTWQQSVQTITVPEVIEDVLKYKQFYQSSGGGITVSGGEPLLQPEFLRDLFIACKKENIHTIVDTAGYGDKHNFDVFLPYTDKVLYSIKAIDQDKHRQITARDNTVILENLRYIIDKTSVTVRYVIIPGVTDAKEDIKKLGDFINSLNVRVPVELLGYHTMGKPKWEKMDREYQLENVRPATKEDMEKAVQRLKEQNIYCFY